MDETVTEMTITAQKDRHWLVRINHQFGGGESISLCVMVRRGPKTLGQIQKEAYDRAEELMRMQTGHQPEST